MGAFDRLGILFKSSTNALFASAPDPRQTFANAYQNQRDLLGRVQQSITDMGAAKQRLQAKTVEVEHKLPALAAQAKAFLLQAREDLARIALQRREVAAMELRSLREQIGEVEQEEHRLTLVEQRLATQIEAFFARQEVIAARYTAAEAQVRVNEALGGVSQELADLDVELERAEARTEHMQARASALDELVDDGILQTRGSGSRDAVERQLASVDVEAAVEVQLSALRAEVARARRR